MSQRIPMRDDPAPAVVFRGSKAGLAVVLSDEPEFAVLKRQLSERLAAAGGFFKGAAVVAEVGTRELTDRQLAELRRALEEHGLKLRAVTGRQAAAEPLPTTEVTAEERGSLLGDALSGIDTMLVRRTLRSGQRIRHSGHVVICGDVNAGAEVIAGGDILVFGALRGVAHAGVSTGDEAIVAALRLDPVQLRIGSVYSRSPDRRATQAAGPEMARIRDGRVTVEPFVTLNLR